MAQDNPNTIITTIAKQLTYDIAIAANDPCICFDTSNQRIGINTITPSVALDIQNGSAHIGGDLVVNNIYCTDDISCNGNIYLQNSLPDKGVLHATGVNLAYNPQQGYLICPSATITDIYSTNIIIDYPLTHTLLDDNAVTKKYLNDIKKNLEYFENVNHTTGYIDFSTNNSPFDNSYAVIDGSSVTEIAANPNNRLLINYKKTGGYTGISNGVYTIDSGKNLSRTSDLSHGIDICNGIFVYVDQGIKNKNTGWALQMPANGVTIGDNSLIFHNISSFGGNNDFAHLKNKDNTFTNQNTFENIVKFQSQDLASITNYLKIDIGDSSGGIWPHNGQGTDDPIYTLGKSGRGNSFRNLYCRDITINNISTSDNNINVNSDIDMNGNDISSAGALGLTKKLTFDWDSGTYQHQVIHDLSSSSTHSGQGGVYTIGGGYQIPQFPQSDNTYNTHWYSVHTEGNVFNIDNFYTINFNSGWTFDWSRGINFSGRSTFNDDVKMIKTLTVSGGIDMAGGRITNCADPTALSDVATKNYVDTHTGTQSTGAQSYIRCNQLDVLSNQDKLNQSVGNHDYTGRITARHLVLVGGTDLIGGADQNIATMFSIKNLPKSFEASSGQQDDARPYTFVDGGGTDFRVKWPMGTYWNGSNGGLTQNQRGGEGAPTSRPWAPVMYNSYDTNLYQHYSTSDRKLKTNIIPFMRKLDVVKKLNPVYFQWIDSCMNDYGFIAQELELLIPGIITNDKDASGELTMVYTHDAVQHFIPVLTKAIQDLDEDKNKEVAALESRITELEVENATLKTQMTAIVLRLTMLENLI